MAGVDLALVFATKAIPWGAGEARVTEGALAIPPTGPISWSLAIRPDDVPRTIILTCNGDFIANSDTIRPTGHAYMTQVDTDVGALAAAILCGEDGHPLQALVVTVAGKTGVRFQDGGTELLWLPQR